MNESRLKKMRDEFKEKLVAENKWHSTNFNAMVEESRACLSKSEDYRAIVAGSLKCLDAAAAACQANSYEAIVFNGRLSSN